MTICGRRCSKETELFFGSIIHEDRSMPDLLDANYTFVNERLARHYGIPDVYGSTFRRVELTPESDMRRGLLGQAAWKPFRRIRSALRPRRAVSRLCRFF